MNKRIDDLRIALNKTVGLENNNELILNILATLDKKKFFNYHNENTINLLTSYGRVLCAIIEDPTMTQRALAIYLDLSETMIDKTIKTLISFGLITKTKANRKNTYQCHPESILKHPDIQHLLQSINTLDLSKLKTQSIDLKEIEEIF